MSFAFSAQGTKLMMDDGTGTYAWVAEVLSIRGPSEKTDVTDVTSHSSPNAYREFIASLKNPGSLVFDLNWLPGDATQDGNTGIYSKYSSRIKNNYKLILPDTRATEIDLVGIVVNHDKTLPIDKQATAACEIKITGQPVVH